MMAGAGLYWRTLRHLKAAQVYHLARFRLTRPAPDLSPPPPMREGQGAWTAPVADPPSMTGPDTFLFLNEPGSLVQGWDDPARSKLWRYNLHYFDDLTAQDAADRRHWHAVLIARWLVRNPPGHGAGWEPFPTALRMVNWIKASLGGMSLSPDATRSLAIQARWLARRLERHLSANHLLADAKALYFAGAFFSGPEARTWRELGRTILLEELPQQILADGGHYELSPMYHALVLGDVLDILNVLQWTGIEDRVLQGVLSGRVVPMLDWLAAMSHPDGQIAFFNDAALGIAPPPAELSDYALRLGLTVPTQAEQPLLHLRDSGYLRLTTACATVIADVAKIGPDHQPGHAHADTLSFELSLDGRRVIVNGGTSVYGTDAERLRQRGTAAHNTVVVGGRDSSEVWSGFRVGRRARPTLIRAETTQDGISVAASHDGYRRLPGRPVHRRDITLTSASLHIQDFISGPGCEAEAWFHFAPDITLESEGQDGLARIANRTILQWHCDSGTARVVASTHHPRFGISLPSQSIVVLAKDNRTDIRFNFDNQ